MSDSEQQTQADQPIIDQDAVQEGVSQAIRLTLGAGASVAKIMARATAGNRSVAEPRQESSEFDQLVHYGLATVVNVIGTIANGVNEFRNPEQQPVHQQPAGSAAPVENAPPVEIPTVPAGATLRLPMSVENPGTEPMVDMYFTCLDIQTSSGGDASPLTPANIHIDPVPLTVDPKNFEKLTTSIAVPVATPPGRYHLTIGLSNGEFETTLLFEVLPAEA